MAARNPTTWNVFTDEYQFLNGKPILASGASAVFDDMTYILDCEQLGITDCFWPRQVTYAADANNWVEIARYYLDLKDMGDEAATVAAGNVIGCEWSAYCWGDATRVPGVGIRQGAGAPTSTNTGAASATPAWSNFAGITGAFNVNTNDTENAIVLYARVESPGAAGSIWIAGFGLFVSET